jgi:hypothetical protein
MILLGGWYVAGVKSVNVSPAPGVGVSGAVSGASWSSGLSSSKRVCVVRGSVVREDGAGRSVVFRLSPRVGVSIEAGDACTLVSLPSTVLISTDASGMAGSFRYA